MRITDKNRKYNWGVALSGGGARGFAHLGALKALDETGVKIEVLSGTSAGSLVGAFYADGYKPEEIYALFGSIKLWDIATTTLPKEGFFKTTGLQSILKKYLRAKKFEDLQLPLRVVASDIERGETHVFTKGDLIPAVIASCSVPLIFTPMEIEGRHYVDGGLFNNFPVSVIRQDCRKVIGIDISPVIAMKYDKSVKYIVERTMNYMVGANTVEAIRQCDYRVASEEISHYSLFDFKHAKDIYTKGYKMGVDCFKANQERLERDIRRLSSSKGLKHTLRKITGSDTSLRRKEK